MGSTLKFCNLLAFDPENGVVDEKLLCFKKLGPDVFELRIVKTSGEIGTKATMERSLMAIDDWMKKFGACTYVEWVPRSILSASFEDLIMASANACPTSSLTSRRGGHATSPHSSETQSSLGRSEDSTAEALVLDLLSTSSAPKTVFAGACGGNSNNHAVSSVPSINFDDSPLLL